MVSSDPFKWETWHTFLAQGLAGTGSKLPQKVVDFLLHNYPDELLKSFWKIRCRVTWTSCASYRDKCVTQRGRGSKGRREQLSGLRHSHQDKCLSRCHPGCPLAGRRQIFPDSKPELGACFSPREGALRTLLLDWLPCFKTFDSNAEDSHGISAFHHFLKRGQWKAFGLSVTEKTSFCLGFGYLHEWFFN